MNSVRLILLISTIILFNGCSNGDSAEDCLNSGYKGVVVNKAAKEAYIYCSDGELTTEGTYYKTSDGVKLIEHNYRSSTQYTTEYIYLKF